MNGSIFAWKYVALGVTIVACAATSALALPVSVTFTGQVVGGTGSFIIPQFLQRFVSVGSPVSGTFVYESETQDSNTLATRGDYFQPPGASFELMFGSASIASDGSDYFVQILDEHPLGSAGNQPIDRLGVISRSNSAISPAGGSPRQLQLFFYAPNAGIESDGLSEFTEALVSGIALQGSGQIATTFGQSPQVLVNFMITSVELVSLPDPRFYL